MRVALAASVLLACSSPAEIEPPTPSRPTRLAISADVPLPLLAQNARIERNGSAFRAVFGGFSLEGTKNEERLVFAGTRVSLRTELLRNRWSAKRVEYDLREGVLVADRRGVVERVIARDEGVEHTWTFDQRPGDRGDLRVMLRLDVSEPARTDDSGLHFANPPLRIGHGTWIDAHGKKTAVPARWTGSHVEYRVPDHILESSTYPAVLDPVIGTDLTLDAAVTTQSTALPKVAVSGGTYYVVFSDLTGTWAARVSSAGTVLDRPAIRISDHPYDDTNRIYPQTDGALVLSQGVVRTFSSTGVIGGPIALRLPIGYARSSNQFANFSSAGGVGCQLQRYRPDDTSIGTIQLSSGLAPTCVVATDDTDWLAAAFEPGFGPGSPGSGFYVAPVAAGATSLGTRVFLGSSDMQKFAVGFNPTLGEYLAVFQRNDSWRGLQRLAKTGATLGSELFLDANFIGFDTRVLGEDDRWLVLTTGPNAYHVTSTPSVIESTPVAVTATKSIDWVSDGTRYLAPAPGALVPIQKNLTAGAPIPVAFRSNAQSPRAIVPAPDGRALLLYSDDRPPAGVYVVRLGSDGKSLDMTATSIGDVTIFGWGWSGSRWWLLSGTSSSVQLQWIKSTGGLDTSSTLSLPFTNVRTAIAGSSSIFVFSWTGEFVRIAADGAMLDSTPKKLRGPLFGSELGVGFDGARVLAGYRTSTSTMFVDAIAADGAVTANGSLPLAGTPAIIAAFGKAYLSVRDYSTIPIVTMREIAADGSLGTAETWPLAGLVGAPDAIYASKGPTLATARYQGGPPPGSLDGAPMLAPTAKQAVFAPTGTGRILVAQITEGAPRITTHVVSYGLDNGAACTSGGECESGQCVDGVCCMSSCGGRCEACDVPGKLGRCTPVTGRPHGARPACSGSSSSIECEKQCLGFDRLECGFPLATAPCSKDACTTGVETHASTCDGAGACRDVYKACGGYRCAGSRCAAACTSIADCESGYYCKSGACVPLEALGKSCATSADCSEPTLCTEGVCCASADCGAGKTCTSKIAPGLCRAVDGSACGSADECASGFCVDSVCCATACTNQCAACDVAGSLGKCTPVRGKPHGSRAACTTDATNVCGARSCDGNDTTTCAAFVGVETACGMSKCEGGVLTRAGVCGGAGACVVGTSAPCDGFACADETSCRTTCTSSADCVAGYVCNDGRCRARVATCSADLATSTPHEGEAEACAPFLCNPNTGTCRKRCDNTADCAPGRSCSSAGQCEDALPPMDEGGCAMQSSQTTPPLWLLLALAAAAGRRRTAR